MLAQRPGKRCEKAERQRGILVNDGIHPRFQPRRTPGSPNQTQHGFELVCFSVLGASWATGIDRKSMG